MHRCIVPLKIVHCAQQQPKQTHIPVIMRQKMATIICFMECNNVTYIKIAVKLFIYFRAKFFTLPGMYFITK